MKNKRIIWPAILLVCCAVICCLVYFTNYKEDYPVTPPIAQTFNLDHEFYEGASLLDINEVEFEQLINDKKSFVIIAHMDFCPAETPLTTTAEQLISEDGYTFYEIKAEPFRKTSLAESVQYLPSAAIYHEGSLVKYLDAESDDDIPYYQSAEGLRNWLSNYINLKEEK